ncbi:transferrin-binding protein-like solute binding protein [Ursidibacter maritimus]|uniref:Transferrin-binding protein-like solute binding protein n=1 Tax=Ursidibacter maritimus TaxID=1331689 RepID=A0A949T343_9PAST|nr:Slam-dependent surface lipoprotein [Ursidibacter maritimus]KAE9541948.1 hypothetical protein A1D26_07140 [Ursidibacter maritimus]MBV6523250.1 transferrin-binding protein-like solute binding protein [Ursidibacter maritimus]MBV6525706.1 transferrin-binding protein-like solute binding protein [Ursidibacter maritimus]MBV6527398.1 transferrin-binding protein-like solute binding protein [Ursidibacter maritimus]MBV6529423.1 transferrin-binding protein-like solute binding protein [Ursidibacter mari
MKKLTKSTLTVLAIAVLSACSSGGNKGGDNSSNNTTATSSSTQNTATQSDPKTQQPNNNSNKIFGGVYYGGKSYPIDDVSKHPTTLIIAGHEFVLQQPGLSSGSFTTIGQNVKYNGTILQPGVYSGSKFSTAFGYIAAGSRSAVYYQGNNPTDVLPKGKATYIGDSVYVNHGQPKTQNGKLNLNVDFDKKSLEGTIFAAEDNIAAVTVKEAQLNGNSFAGKVVQNGQEADVNGKFYGINAGELAGAYSDGTGNSGWQGAFGAKKQ